MISSRTFLLFSFLFQCAVSPSLMAQKVIPLWGENPPPYSKPNSVEEYEQDCWKVVCAYNIVTPTMTLYLPRGESNDTAVIILPGGGYEAEAVYHEGYEIAETLARHGTTAVVLKYRLPNPETATKPERVPGTDVRHALKLLREKQGELGFKASKFGVMGFSAGSHLATEVSINRSSDPLENPDFSMLIYGVTRMTVENQDWLEKTLYHREMSPSEIEEQTFLKRVDANTPPAFLVHSYDDDTCHYSESTLYAEALQDNGVETEMHLFARGGHGFGPGRDEDGTGQWLSLAGDWLDRQGVIEQ
jgi:acetyl esterase/lipase